MDYSSFNINDIVYAFTIKCSLTDVGEQSSHMKCEIFSFVNSDMVRNRCEFMGVCVSHFGNHPDQGILQSGM